MGICRSLARGVVATCLLFLTALTGCGDSAGNGTAVATAPELPGPYATERYDTSFSNDDGVFASTVVYPTGEAAAPYPLVVMAPGACSIREWYTWVGEHLATYGYVVLTFTAPAPCLGGPFAVATGFFDAFAFLEAEGARTGSPIQGRVKDSGRVIAGHSLGAIAALLALSEQPDITAAVAFAPGPLGADAMARITTPTLLLSGSLDAIVPAERARSSYDLLTETPRLLAEVSGGNHVGFCTLGSLCDVAGGLLEPPRELDDPERQAMLSKRFTTAWLERFVRGKRAYEAYLTGAEAQADLQAGLLSELRSDLD